MLSATASPDLSGASQLSQALFPCEARVLLGRVCSCVVWSAVGPGRCADVVGACGADAREPPWIDHLSQVLSLAAGTAGVVPRFHVASALSTHEVVNSAYSSRSGVALEGQE